MKWLTAFAAVLAGIVMTFAHDAAAQEKGSEYFLGAGDNIRIFVFQNPDLTLETRVSENGSITYPLIGVVRVGGMSIAAAERVIAKALSAGRFIEDPQVNILLVQNRSNQVAVLGQVNRAGRFPLETAQARLSDMLAAAGGISASGEEFAVVTGLREGKPFRQEVDLARIFSESALQDDPVVMGGDVVYVHRMQVFYIYGEVQRAGSHRLERGMTVRQALAQGGGPTLRGAEAKIRLHRRGSDGKVNELTPQVDDIVRPNDVLFVPERHF